jgi:hypothetical protein
MVPIGTIATKQSKMRGHINDFSDCKNKGEIRVKAELLLGKLAAAYLGNIAWDNRQEIRKKLDDINNSGIDWSKDVVKSIKDQHAILTSREVIDTHMSRKDDSFSK